MKATITFTYEIPVKDKKEAKEMAIYIAKNSIIYPDFFEIKTKKNENILLPF